MAFRVSLPHDVTEAATHKLRMNVFKLPSGRWKSEVRHAGFFRSMTFESKKTAQNWWSQTEAEYLAGKRGQPLNKSAAQAFEKYAKEVSPQKKGARWEILRLAKLSRDPLLGPVTMPEFTTGTLAKWRDRQSAAGLADGSILREMTLIRSVFKKAREEWRWLSVNPFEGLQKPKQPKSRSRRIDEAEIAAVLSWLGYDEAEPVETQQQLTAVAFLLAIETTMRSGDILAIKGTEPSKTSAWVDFARRAVFRSDSKNGDAKAVPLNARAIELLRKVEPKFFAGVSDQVRDQLFRRAVKMAQIVDLKFHDSRHEAASRLAKKLSVLELAKVMGVRDPKTVMIYYNPTVEELADKL
jgi:integrase